MRKTALQGTCFVLLGEQERVQDPGGVVAKSLEPLLEHAEIRSLLDEISPEELLEWVRRAEELTLGLFARTFAREGVGT